MPTKTTAEPSTDTDLLRVVSRAAWLASHDERNSRFHSNGYCPTRVAPYSTADPDGTRVHEVCRVAGCLDLLHELLLRTLKKLKPKLTTTTIDDVSAYAFRTACRELTELRRAERIAQGFPAKPARGDGTAARINLALSSQPNESAEWLVALFRIMRSFPYSAQNLTGQWPVGGLVAERTRYLADQPSSPAVIRREAMLVLSIANSVAGHKWVYCNLILPLHACGARSILEDSHSAPAEDCEVRLLSSMLRTTYQRYRAQGYSPQEAFERASVDVTGRPAPPPTSDTKAALSDLELVRAAG